MQLNVEEARDVLQAFEFKRLLVEILGWNNPARHGAQTYEEQGRAYTVRHLAELAGVVVVEIRSDGAIPDAKTRDALQKRLAQEHYENIAVFTDAAQTQSLWRWVKRDGGKLFPREHTFFKGQPGDLFLSKISGIFFDFSDIEQGVSLIGVNERIRQALDVERVTKKFYEEFKTERVAFTELIQGIDDERDRRWYASVLLNRLMFIYFLQEKDMINNRQSDYLQVHLQDSPREYGPDAYYREFLRPLFFQGFALPEDKRAPEAKKRIGTVPYLNGSLFLEHPIEERWPGIQVPDKAFANLFALFTRYSWNLNDTPGGKDDEISPDVLGYIFEKFINQKAFGAYYTRPEITEYLCEQTIHRLILDRVNPDVPIPGVPARHFDTVGDMLLSLDAGLCRRLLRDILPNLTLLDPACGSGAFLVAAMKTLMNLYGALVGWIETHNDRELRGWLDQQRGAHRSLSYHFKREIIVRNLYGVDILEEATEIARLRLFLALVASARNVSELEPLPNIDFNILPGNSLIGMLDVEAKEFEEKQQAQQSLFKASQTYRELLAEKNRLVSTYRATTVYRADITSLRDNIEDKKREARATLNALLLQDFRDAGAKFEQATWDDAKRQEGRPIKRLLTAEDIASLRPFHWGYEFDAILNERGGFDAIITNPPWETFKPDAKEFFLEHSELVSKNKMTIKEFEEKQGELLQNSEIKAAWLDYLSQFPHVSAFYRAAPQYRNQIAIVNGKKAGTDINLYKLFLEQCFNLLREDGQCGIVLPSGLYSDLGAKQLREMLFTESAVHTLFGLSNEKYLFEGVHHAFRFCLLTFCKGKGTDGFRAAFRINPREAIGANDLYYFLRARELHIVLSVDLIRRLSPDSLSVMEFKSEADVDIAQKMLRFPLLGERLEGTWNFVLGNEFHMTNDSHLFRTAPGPGRLPLYEGKMIHQFRHDWGEPKYWVEEAEARKAICGRNGDTGQTLNYQRYRLAHRSVASSTNERTMICSVLPQNVFFAHSLNASKEQLSGRYLLYIVAILNSLVFDYLLRQKVAGNLTMFYIYQMPAPRLTEKDAGFTPIVERAARLVCTTPEFDDLAREVGLNGYHDGATDLDERARLRAELDALVAHLYGVTEDEFAHILASFPLVPDKVKADALAAFCALTPTEPLSPADPLSEDTALLIRQGENEAVEFKRTLEYVADEDLAAKRISLDQKPRIQKDVVHSALKTICAFLNSAGGTLLIGAHNDGYAVGIENDLTLLGKDKRNPNGFELKLRALLKDRFTPLPLDDISVRFPVVEGKTLCRVDVAADHNEIYHLDGKVYVRNGNQTLELTGADLTHWIRRRSQRI